MSRVVVVGSTIIEQLTYAQKLPGPGETLVGTRCAMGYGGKGILLTDPAKIDEVLDEAKRLASEGTAVCINVHLAASDFREGSISI